MDKDARTTGPAVEATDGPRRIDGDAKPDGSRDPAANRSPEKIRADIEHTRAQVGDTVEALAARTDVKRHAQQRVTETKATLRRKRDELTAQARSTTPETARQTSQQLLAKVRTNPPVALAAAALAAFLLGQLTGRRS